MGGVCVLKGVVPNCAAGPMTHPTETDPAPFVFPGLWLL